MTEEEKKQVAAFRFGVICDLVNGVHLEPGEQERLIRDKCARKWQIPFSTKTRISRSTILRWVRLYRQSNGKLDSLYPKERSDRGVSRGMDEETSLALVQLRKEMPKAPVGSLVETMKKRGLVSFGVNASLSTVYRFLHQHNLIRPSGGNPTTRDPLSCRGRGRAGDGDVGAESA